MEEISVRTALNNIMDCFTGSDCGIKFATVWFALEDLDKNSKAGDLSAYEVLKVLFRFSKLIDIITQK